MMRLIRREAQRSSFGEPQAYTGTTPCSGPWQRGTFEANLPPLQRQWDLTEPRSVRPSIGVTSWIAFLAVGLQVAFVTNIYAQWKQLDVGKPGLVQAVAVIDGDVFAGTMAGIYRSTDNGASWTNVSSVFAYCFASRGLEIFAGTYHNGVLRSTDGGKTWVQVDTSFNRWIMALAIKDTVIFAGGAGMFRSTDDGASWVTIQNGMQRASAIVTGLAIDGAKLFASTFGGLMLSTNDGDSWACLTANALPNGVANCVAAHDSLILAGYTGPLARSSDYGKTWTNPKVPTGIVLTCILDSNYDGRQVASGVYYYRLITPSGSITKKAVLIK